MIVGVVNARREAVVPLRVCGPQAQEDVEAVVDTSFNGFAALPPALIAGLDLPQLGRGRAILADGSEAVFAIHEATVIWDDRAVTVEVDAAGATLLVGMALLEGSLLSVHAVRGGQVTIRWRP